MNSAGRTAREQESTQRSVHAHYRTFDTFRIATFEFGLRPPEVVNVHLLTDI